MSNEKLKVLIVDDEEGILDFMQKILNLKGYDAYTAPDGAEAMSLFYAQRPDICLLDVHLSYSKLDGVEVLNEIKNSGVKTECLMITRITDEEKILKCKKLGANDYLLKPVNTKDLLQMLSEISARIKQEGSNG